MYKKTPFFIALAVISVSCDSDKSKHVVQERYIHKYGYDVSQDEWDSHSYPGQVLTTKRNGQVIVKTFEDNHLHGPTTTTWAHSQTVKALEEYSKGVLKRRVDYSIRATPEKETLFLGKDSIMVTKWYPSGTPFSKETLQDDKLLSAEYYSLTNELESKIENGSGVRLNRDHSGSLLSKQTFQNHQIIDETTFHANKTPKTIANLKDEKKHGEYKEFLEDGSPLMIENYAMGERNGLSIYFQNSMKYLQVEYVQGLKHGTQKRFVDGEICIEKNKYQIGQKHGPTIVYCDGSAKTTWHFNNQLVSKSKYEELLQRNEAIAAMQR